jgi:hypothetical protein
MRESCGAYPETWPITLSSLLTRISSSLEAVSVPEGGRFFYAVNALGKFIRTPLAKNSKFFRIDARF